MSTAGPREVQVDATTRRKPRVVARLAEWEYLEQSFHRMLCGWGRHFSGWNDKVNLFRHIWDEAECVRRIRERLGQFPGTASNLDAPVSRKLEDLANAVLLAPSFEDALDGMFHFYNGALVKSYLHYAQSAHPVHDAPTLAAISENVRVKEQFRLWLRDYRRRRPHQIDPDYRKAIESALANVNQLQEPLPVEESAHPVGVRTDFRPPLRAAHPAGTEPRRDLMPYLEADFTASIEARRLFWCYGYLLEMNLAEDQMKWIWDAADYPWDFIQDVTRHMWDESRHGDSGYSRLLDFGIPLEEIGYSYYDKALPNSGPWDAAEGQSEPLSPKDLYESIFFIGMVAETGHFTVKHEAYDDFREGGDMESAEMMLFDIIDETSHVQYAHRWLPMLAERAGVDEDFKRRGAQERKRLQREATDRAERFRTLPKSGEDYELYQSLLARMRDVQPLANVHSCPPRSYKPM